MAETMDKITIITRREKQEELREALQEMGISGMTVTAVTGCGVQHATIRYYRGQKQEVRLLPKVMFELVVPEPIVEAVIRTSRKVLCTGEIGDGKIFVEEQMEAVKIRTKERGIEAL